MITQGQALSNLPDMREAHPVRPVAAPKISDEVYSRETLKDALRALQRLLEGFKRLVGRVDWKMAAFWVFYVALVSGAGFIFYNSEAQWRREHSKRATAIRTHDLRVCYATNQRIGALNHETVKLKLRPVPLRDCDAIK